MFFSLSLWIYILVVAVVVLDVVVSCRPARERGNWTSSMNVVVDNEMCRRRPRHEKGIAGADRIDHRRWTERKIDVIIGT